MLSGLGTERKQPKPKPRRVRLQVRVAAKEWSAAVCVSTSRSSGKAVPPWNSLGPSCRSNLLRLVREHSRAPLPHLAFGLKVDSASGRAAYDGQITLASTCASLSAANRVCFCNRSSAPIFPGDFAMAKASLP